MSAVKISSYKGHPTISLDADAKYPFTFGIAKAKLLLEHYDAVKAFVAQHDKPASQPDRFDMAVEDNMRDQAGA